MMKGQGWMEGHPSLADGAPREADRPAQARGSGGHTPRHGWGHESQWGSWGIWLTPEM